MRFRTLKDLEVLIDSDEPDDDDKPTGACLTMARDRVVTFTAKTDERGLDADAIVFKRATALCYSRQWDPKNFQRLSDAVVEVLNSDKGLGEAYKQLLSAEQLKEACE